MMMMNPCFNVLTLEHSDPLMIERAKNSFKNSNFLNEFIPIPVSSLRGVQEGEVGGQESSQSGDSNSYQSWCMNHWGGVVGSKMDIGGPECPPPSDDGPNKTSITFSTPNYPLILAYSKLKEHGFKSVGLYHIPHSNTVGFCEDGVDYTLNYSQMSRSEMVKLPHELYSVFQLGNFKRARDGEDNYEGDGGCNACCSGGNSGSQNIEHSCAKKTCYNMGDSVSFEGKVNEVKSCTEFHATMTMTVDSAINATEVSPSSSSVPSISPLQIRASSSQPLGDEAFVSSSSSATNTAAPALSSPCKILLNEVLESYKNVSYLLRISDIEILDYPKDQFFDVALGGCLEAKDAPKKGDFLYYYQNTTKKNKPGIYGLLEVVGDISSPPDKNLSVKLSVTHKLPNFVPLSSLKAENIFDKNAIIFKQPKICIQKVVSDECNRIFDKFIKPQFYELGLGLKVLIE